MHDQLSIRIASILFKLNQGEKLHPQTLADEFGVDIRTIQRDLNVRLAALPIQRDNHHYLLDPSYLGRLNTNSLKSFAILAGIKGLFPRLDAHFLNQLSREMQHPNLQVQGQTYEGFDTAAVQRFDQLEQAIRNHKTLSFHYQKRDGSNQHYSNLHPYRLTNHGGIWYLAAADSGQIKSFAIARISLISILSESFTPNPSIEQQLNDDDSVWLGQKQTVTLEVTGLAIQYFKRRSLLPKQQLIEETETALRLTTQIRHQDQLLPIVQYWIPYVKVIEPRSFQDTLNNQLQNYLNIFLSTTNLNKKR